MQEVFGLSFTTEGCRWQLMGSSQGFSTSVSHQIILYPPLRHTHMIVLLKMPVAPTETHKCLQAWSQSVQKAGHWLGAWSLQRNTELLLCATHSSRHVEYISVNETNTLSLVKLTFWRMAFNKCCFRPQRWKKVICKPSFTICLNKQAKKPFELQGQGPLVVAHILSKKHYVTCSINPLLILTL